MSDIDEMHDMIIHRWNRKVTPEDDVYVLGDVTFKKKYLWVISRLNGVKHLISGNHDPCWGFNIKSAESHEKHLSDFYEAGFHTIRDEMEIKIGLRKDVILSHFPPADAHDDDDFRYPEARPKPKPGQMVVHGHVHDKWRRRRGYINVGVDAWNFQPVSEHQLNYLMEYDHTPKLGPLHVTKSIEP